MRSLMDMGIKGLMAYQYAMTISSQNLTRADEESYGRRDVIFAESFMSMYGNGVYIASTKRIYDDALTRNLQISNSALARSDSLLQNLKDFEMLFDENSYSIGNYINESINALNVINVNPSSAQAREQYLFQMKNVADRFNALGENINTQQSTVNKSIQADVKAINDATGRLAQINSMISNASGEERNNMYDERDALLQGLAKYIGFDSSVDDQGVMSLELSNGTPLVNGNYSYDMVARASEDDPYKLNLFAINGSSEIMVTNLIDSGELAGLLGYQSTALDVSRSALGRLALLLSQQFNEQNRLGMDLNGQLGGDIFTDINTTEAMRHRVINNTGNQGSGVMSIQINDASQLDTSDYQLEFDSPTHYKITRLSDYQVMADGDVTSFPTDIDMGSFTLTVDSGTFVSGDRYLLSPTRDAARDMAMVLSSGSKLALASPVVTMTPEDNKGSGVINMTGVTNTRNPAFIMSGYLNPPIRVEFTSATTYRLVNSNDDSILEDNLNYDPSFGADVFPTPGGMDPGYRISLSGEMVAGDTFEINYNNNGVGDNSNGLLLAALYQKGFLENGNLTFSDSWRALSNDISLKTNSAQISQSSTNMIQMQAQRRRDDLSAVSREEETMNMRRYLEAFEASAKIIDAGQQLFNTIIGLNRR